MSQQYDAAISNLSALLESLRSRDTEFLESSRRQELEKLLSQCQNALRSEGQVASPRSEKQPASPRLSDAAVRQRALLQKDSDEKDIRVLIVDDDKIAAMLISNMLTKLKIKNQFVENGQAALDLLYNNPDYFQLVLCDVNMPGLDGGEVLLRVLAEPQLRHIPIVMVSGDTDQNKAKELVAAGAKDYILKPIQQISLVGLGYKINAWQQARSVQHLSAVYDITTGLLCHIKVVLGHDKTRGTLADAQGSDALQKSGASSSSASSHEIKTVRCAVVRAASLPMRQLLGVTETEIKEKNIDILKYILPEDRDELCARMLDTIFKDDDDAGSLPSAASRNDGVVAPPKARNKVLWRWIDYQGNSVPVVGVWTRLGGKGECAMLLESTSLLPSLMLKREKEMRRSAEIKAEEARQKTSRLENDLKTTKRTDESMRNELTSMLVESADFARMVTDNPHMLTWRFYVEDGRIDWVSPRSCQSILGYHPDELKNKLNKDILHPDDVEMANAGLRNINKSLRFRRVRKDGVLVVLESLCYAWWDEQQTIVIVTEYDITHFMNSPAVPPIALASSSISE